MKEGDLYTREFIVNEEIYHGFISLFKDRNPLHTDSLFARSMGFSDRVMHGNILNGFLSFFVGECLPLKNLIIHSQSIKYKMPVYLEDKLNFSALITHYSEAVNAMVFSFAFKNSKGKKVAVGTVQVGLLV